MGRCALEQFDLHDSSVGDDDLDRLAGFARLKSLNLNGTSVSGAGLAKLAPLESLEELAIDDDMARAAGFEALITLKRLRALHIADFEFDETDDSASLALDDGHELRVSPSDVDGLRRALAALRRSHSGIVIDAGYDAFQENGDLEPPWSSFDHDRDLHSFARRWLSEL
ncbi:MAG TPA: hypothetical protein VND64_25825 [Pirellulales bacterium]|nr:hypothetical protein [Pirellulales bacterium]